MCLRREEKSCDLPAGATAVDFAYAVHTDIGNIAWRQKLIGNYRRCHLPLSVVKRWKLSRLAWAAQSGVVRFCGDPAGAQQYSTIFKRSA